MNVCIFCGCDFSPLTPNQTACDVCDEAWKRDEAQKIYEDEMRRQFYEDEEE